MYNINIITYKMNYITFKINYITFKITILDKDNRFSTLNNAQLPKYRGCSSQPRHRLDVGRSPSISSIQYQVSSI